MQGKNEEGQLHNVPDESLSSRQSNFNEMKSRRIFDLTKSNHGRKYDIKELTLNKIK